MMLPGERNVSDSWLPDLSFEEIDLLSIGDPGVDDPAYQARRDDIARLARRFRKDPDHPVLDVDYTDAETALWRDVYDQLDEAHRRRACSLYRNAKRTLGMTRDHIPQLASLSQQLDGLTGFGLAPIEGLVETRSFLSQLADRVMLCTQYIRHPSRPDYTPEPDIIHEAIGHIPNFTNPDFADFSQFIGHGARKANAKQLEQLGRLYWFTVEFGLIEEEDEIKAFGAGLLSSFRELEHAFSEQVERRSFNLEEVVERHYDYSDMQPVLFVIPSYAFLKDVTRKFIAVF